MLETGAGEAQRGGMAGERSIGLGSGGQRAQQVRQRCFADIEGCADQVGTFAQQTGTGGPGLALHLIGPLQSNKAKEAVALFDAIHSVDRDSIAAALAKEIARQDRHPQLFVQINTGEEPQKAGIAPAEADAFLARCRETYGLAIAGLMCIPPVDEAPAPHFALTAKIAARNGLKLLSMGMSADFAIAIQFGATHVRVGSAIFGTR